MPKGTQIVVNDSTVGEPIEAKMRRMFNNKEPISEGSPLRFSERQEGVIAEADIRTDKWETNIEATDKLSGTHRDKRQARIVEMDKKKHPEKYKEEGKNGDKSGAQSTDGNGK